jgi:hypothetical protein
VGLALPLDLLALVDDPIPLPLLPKLRLQLYNPANLFVGDPLLVMALVGILSYSGATLRLKWAIPTLKPTHDGDDGLWGQSVGWQLDT